MPTRKKLAFDVDPSLAAVLDAPDDLEARARHAAHLRAAGSPLGDYVELSAAIVSARPPERFALVERAEALWRSHGTEWLAGWARPSFETLRLHAGLPRELGFGKNKPSLPDVARVIATTPVTALRFRDTALGTLKPVLAMTGSERMRALSFSLRPGAGVIAALAQHPWPRLTELAFGVTPPTDAELAAMLAVMPSLERLDGAFGIGALSSWPGVAQLQHLRSSGSLSTAHLTQIPGLAVESLGAAMLSAEDRGPFPTVRSLALSAAGGLRRGLLPPFPGLIRLTLPVPGRGDFDEELLEELAEAPVWEQLESFRFGGVAGSVAWMGQRVLPRCGRLRSLSVRSSPALPEVLASLASLESLSIDSSQLRDNPPCPVDDALLARIAPSLSPRLRELTILGDFGIDGVRALVAAAPPELERVCLSSRRFDAECVEALRSLGSVTHIELVAYDFESFARLSAASRGRFLGPKAGMVGPQRAPIWSHES